MPWTLGSRWPQKHPELFWSGADRLGFQQLKDRNSAPAYPYRLVGWLRGLDFRFFNVPNLRRDLAKLFDVNADEVALAPCKRDATDKILPYHF